MANLNLLELKQLKSLLVGESLPTEAQTSILNILRSQFPDFFSQLTSGLTEAKRKDNDSVIRYLKQNIGKTRQILQKQNLSFLTQQQQNELRDALEKPVATEAVSGQPGGQAAPAGQGLPPTEVTPGGTPLEGMSLPIVPSISTPRIRFIHKIPRVPAEVPVGTENTPFVSQERGATVSNAATSAPVATASTPTTAPTVSATSNTPAAAYSMSSSSVNLPHQTAGSAYSPTPTQPAAASPRRFNFSSFKSSAGSAFKKVQNFASPAGRFFQRNIGKYLTGGNAMNLLGKAGRTGIDALSGITNLGGGQGGVFSPLGRFGRNGGGRGLFGRFGRGGRDGGSLTTKAKGKGGLIFAGSILGLMLLTLVIAMTAPNPTPGQAEPLPPGVGSDLDKKYDFTAFDIFKSDAVNDDLLQKYIDKALAGGKVKTDEQKNLLPSKAKFIRDQAQPAGLNPAIFLGYWESESGFSDYTHPGVRPGSDLGCDPLNPALKTFEDSVLCAVGKSQTTNSRTSQCAISKDIDSPACQAISFQQTEGVKLPINTLKDFLDSYGSKVADPNNLKSDTIVKQTIADLGLVPAINIPPSSATPYTPGGGSGILSCPVNNGSIVYGSKETGGHCATGYRFDCIPPGQPGYTGRETAVDVKGSERMVFLPLLSGNLVEWTIDESGTPINNSEGGGIAVAATASSGGKLYRIRFVHIESSALTVGQKANSATPVGQHVLPSIDKRSLANHVHITIQEDSIYKPADLYFNLCK